MIEESGSPIDYEFVADCFGPLMSLLWTIILIHYTKI
jgi:hypothetical protein